MKNLSKNFLKGIDISHWNGSIDFQKVSQAGIDITFIKATEGTSFIDSCLNVNYKSAKTAGLFTGFYHFFLPEDIKNARDQAIHFAKNISAYSYDCKLVLDVETNKKNLSRLDICKAVESFIDCFQELSGQEIIIYASDNWLKSQLASLVDRYQFWLAHWTNESTASELLGCQKWLGWQYSATGKVPGISGNVDLSWFKKKILI